MTLKNVLEEICAEEYALPANAPAHRFKRRHRLAMNAVLYPDGLPKTERKLPLRRRLLVIAVVAVLAVVTGASASIYHYNGFEFRRKKEKYTGSFYSLLVENAENAPKTIEKIIYDDNVPEDFAFDATYTDNECTFVHNAYVARDRININGDKGVGLDIMQYTKSTIDFFILEEQNVTPVEVKGCNGFIIVTADERRGHTSVIWDSGDYIHVVFAKLPAEEVLEIVENMIEK